MNGVTDLDDSVAQILRRSKKPVILVANKEDKGDARFNVPEFYSLGLGDPVEVSSANGSGTGELLDQIIADMPEPSEDDKPEENVAKFCHSGQAECRKIFVLQSCATESIIQAFLRAAL